MLLNTTKIAIAPKFFRLYSVIVCLFLVCPFIIAAHHFRADHPYLFHTLLFVAGWILWTWIEYHAHRFFMHPSSNMRRTGTSRSHLHHHKTPSELEVKLPHRIALFIFSCLFFYLAHRLNNYFTLFSGFFWGSAAFCYIHYLLHQRWTRYFMPEHHRFHIFHHCKYTDRCFGVSVTWWDHLFFTAPPKNGAISNHGVDFYYQQSKPKHLIRKQS